MKKTTQYLEKRVQYLEDVNRFTLDALEMAASLGDFQPSISNMQDVSVILDETKSRIRSLMQLEAMAFYLVDESNNEFVLSKMDPLHYESYIEKEVGFFIDDGIFAWALREKRPVIVSTKQHERQFIFHVMITSSRIRGMFVGLLEEGDRNIPDMSLSILSIVLLNSTNALESCNLYNMIREINNNLQKKKNYKILFDAAPDGVEVLDAKGNIVDCNKAQTILLGYKREELIGNHTTRFLLNDDKTSFEKRLSNLKKTGHYEREVELVSKAGDIIPVWRKWNAIYDEKMQFVGYVVYNRDLSDHKAANEEKNRLESQLNQSRKMEAVGTLAGGIAHDFNNLLMGIQGNVSLALMDMDSTNPFYERLKNIEQHIQSGAELTGQLLGFAKGGKYEVKPTDLNELIRESSSMFGRTRKEIEIRSTYQKDIWSVEADHGQIEQVLLNIYVNASQAMIGGGEIYLQTENVTLDKNFVKPYEIEPGSYVKITITDTGTGMDKKTRARIFDPFFTTKEMGSNKGTGLGLASAYGIIANHGGIINVLSKKGKGSTFNIYLPASEAKILTERKLPGAFLKGTETVLFVDDEELIINIGEDMLKALGYKVYLARSGKEAIETYKEKQDKIDMVILDMIMPEMDGGKTYDILKKINPDIKVLLSSGYSIDGQATEILKRGCNDFIQKPFRIEHLSLKTRELLENK